MRSALTCVVLLSLVLHTAGVVQAAEPIKIGVFACVTGPGSYIGDPQDKTLRLEVERINRGGGLLGRPLKLFLFDDGSDAKQAVSIARKLIDRDNVDVLIAATITGPTLAVLPLAEDAGIPLISTPGSTAIVDPVKKWLFLSSQTDRMAVEKVYLDMQRRKFTKIGLIAGSRGFDESCRKSAHDLSTKFGINIVADETYAPSDSDMTPQLTRIRKHKDIQTVLDCGSQEPTVITARNYQQLGMGRIPLYFTHSVASHEFITSIGSAGEGVRLPAAAVVIADQLPDDDPQKKPALQYQRAYESAYHEPISTFGAHAKNALLLYIAAVEKVGGTDKAKVRDALEQLKNVVGVDGIFNMSATDHNGLSAASFRMIEIRGGKWKLLY